MKGQKVEKYIILLFKMKVVSALKRLCPDCYIVRRGKKLYLRCKTNPRHKRRQGFGTLNTAYHASASEAQGIRSYDGYRMDTTAFLK